MKNLYLKKDESVATNASHVDISEFRKKIRLRTRYLRNEHLKLEAEKLNQFINRELEKLSQELEIRKQFQSQLEVLVLQKSYGQFRSHFNPEDPTHSDPTAELCNQIPNFFQELQHISLVTLINKLQPSFEEMHKHLKDLKMGKASNHIDPELLRRCNHPIMLQSSIE